MKKLWIFLTPIFLSQPLLVQASGDDLLVKPPILAVDSDRDGVVDYVDQCAFTEDNAVVDDRGCYIIIREPKEIELDVKFAFDSYEIESVHTPDIDAVVKFMQQYPLTRVEVQGHTDSDGSRAYNQRLSQNRAEAVAKVMVRDFGVDTQRITAVGYGEDSPKVDNQLAENRAINRRVVAVIRAVEERRK